MAIITEAEIIALPETELGKWATAAQVKFGTHGTGADLIRWAVIKKRDGISRLIECYFFGLSMTSINDWISKIQTYINSKNISANLGTADHRQERGCVVRCVWRITV